MKRFCTILGVALLIGISEGKAQDNKTNAPLITATYAGIPLVKALVDLEHSSGIKIFYQPEWVEGRKVSTTIKNLTVQDALKAILLETDLVFRIYDSGNIVLLPANETSLLSQFADTKDAVPRETNGILEIGGSKLAPRSQKLTLSGYVKEEKQREPVVGARVMVEKLGIGTATDINGYYQLVLPPGRYEVSFGSIGLEASQKTIQLNSSGTLDIELQEKPLALAEVEVGAYRRDENVSSAQMGVNKIDIKEIKKMPALLGEVDVVKSLQLLPGVSTVGEAASGFNVRGGNTDQNLILMDDVPIFNPSHLFGFFSVFNPDAVQNLTFYRGAIPAQLGGRLSAILDVRQKEGSYKKFQGAGGVGIVSGRLALEWPIMNKKGSILLAGRSSYSNWLFKKLPDVQLRDDKASFYDGTFKVSANVTDKSKYVFSLYRSHDSFQFDPDTVYSWTTTNASFAYNHIFSERLIMNLVALTGNYDLTLDYFKKANEASYETGIRQLGLKADFIYTQGKQKINYGLSSTHYTFNPGKLTPNADGSTINPKILPEDRAIESALYLNDEIELSSRFMVSVGLRYSFYQNIGGGQVFNYQTGKPKSIRTLTDTLAYHENDIIKAYKGAEPRAALRFSLNDNNSIKAGFSRTRQYMHVISNTLTISPIDIWKTSNTYIKPQVGDQVSLGFFKNMKQNTIEASVEGYYKTIQNQLDYKDGASLYLNEALETAVLTANGEAYGVEFLINKKAGRVSGWASYAYSRTWLQTNSEFPEEQVNNGEKYPASYDKPHTLNLVGNYQINRRFIGSANFTFSTGRPFTASTQFYQFQDNIVPVYGLRNAYRIPNYYRLDVSLTVLTNLRKDKKWEGSWNLAIYNMLARQNVYSVFYKHYYGSKVQPYKVSIIGTAIPSITYNFKF
jgi:hypothetical protein